MKFYVNVVEVFFVCIDVDVMLQLRKKIYFILFLTCFCLCIRSGLAIRICCRQRDLVGDDQLHFRYSDHFITVSMTSLRAGAFAV